MQWQVGTKIGAGFGLILVILILAGAVSYRSTVQLIKSGQSQQHTYAVLGQLDEVFSLLQDIQLGRRGYALTGDSAYLQPYRGAMERIKPSIQKVRMLTIDNPREQNRIDQLETLVSEITRTSAQSVELMLAHGAQQGVEFVKSGEGAILMDQARQIIGDLKKEKNGLLTLGAETARQDAVIAKSAIVLGSLLALVSAILADIVITRNIARPLRELESVAERIALGDLASAPLIGIRHDEVGRLAHSFDRMTGSLRALAEAAEKVAARDLRALPKPLSEVDVLGNAFYQMTSNLRDQLGQLIEGSSVLAGAATEIVASTTQLAAGANESAAAVSQTTTTMDEVRQTAEVANQKARHVAESAQKAAQSSQSGRKSTLDMAAGMDRIRRQMDSIGSSMMRLMEQSQTIGQIIATVEDLAAQSNLLAVNAGIEAAKAGEHGKGFGVVAQEVKSLAEQSRQATNQVRTILGDIQKATTTAMMATEQGVKAVEAGTRQTELAEESIRQLSESVSEAAQAAMQIAASSQQQLIGMAQVAGAIGSIKQTTSQNVASARQLEIAARNLSELGSRISDIVLSYKV